MRTPLPPRPDPVADNDWRASLDAEKKTTVKIPASEQAMVRHFNPAWKAQYSWLTLEFHPVLMQYGMKCKVCKTHAPHTKSPFGRGGAGGRDFQRTACKQHDQSKVHLAAMTAERLAQGTETEQRSLLDMLSLDPRMARVIKCLQAAYWIARHDAPIVLYSSLVRFLADLGCPDIKNDEAYGRYFSRYAFGEFVTALAKHLSERQLKEIKSSEWEALAAKDAATEIPEFNVVDAQIRKTAEHLGRSSVDRNTFLHLQEEILKTNLEVQGIFAVRWLSRGDAVQRFCDVLPSLLWMWKEGNKKMWRIGSSFKFHFMLYLLADVLDLLNILNLSFQRNRVDIAEVKNLVDKLKTKLAQRYIEPGAKFGCGTKSRLLKFLEAHAKDRNMNVTGLNADGERVIEAFELHEEQLDPDDEDEGGSDLEACYDLGRRFAEALIKSLSKRMADLRHFDGVQFFVAASYPYRRGDQDMWFSSNMEQLLEMFNHKLPGMVSVTHTG
ncbi:unnamed protein product [Closterium sp. Naga37s-1]|nr:unnamed protein product [Closterium sp. Naga37s-1]